jgi:hypothetical protein
MLKVRSRIFRVVNIMQGLISYELMHGGGLMFLRCFNHSAPRWRELRTGACSNSNEDDLALKVATASREDGRPVLQGGTTNGADALPC